MYWNTRPDYNFPLYRPPSEGENLIIQATLGCSYNRCTFCSMYRTKNFAIKPLFQVLEEIDQAVLDWPTAGRVFLADGDALVLPTHHLMAILNHLNKRLPKLTRVSCYALPANVQKKSLKDLQQLKANKLSLLYYGIETGDKNLLKRIQKGASPHSMIEGLQKADSAGIKVSATVILGLGGKNHWQDHIESTIALLHQAPVTYLSTLQLMLDPMLAAKFAADFDPPFQHQDDLDILIEQRGLVSGLITPPKRIIFRSNHASNALSLSGVLPKDRDKLLALLDVALEDGKGLRPHWRRSL